MKRSSYREWTIVERLDSPWDVEWVQVAKENRVVESLELGNFSVSYCELRTNFLFMSFMACLFRRSIRPSTL